MRDRSFYLAARVMTKRAGGAWYSPEDLGNPAAVGQHLYDSGRDDDLVQLSKLNDTAQKAQGRSDWWGVGTGLASAGAGVLSMAGSIRNPAAWVRPGFWGKVRDTGRAAGRAFFASGTPAMAGYVAGTPLRQHARAEDRALAEGTARLSSGMRVNPLQAGLNQFQNIDPQTRGATLGGGGGAMLGLLLGALLKRPGLGAALGGAGGAAFGALQPGRIDELWGKVAPKLYQASGRLNAIANR